MMLPKKEKHTYLAGGKRWVENNLALVLFKHHCHNKFLHKVTYVKVIQVKLFFQRKRKIIKSIFQRIPMSGSLPLHEREEAEIQYTHPDHST